MNFRLCYRRNLPPPPFSEHRSGCARTNSLVALGALSCVLACLWLTACGKTANQYLDRGNQLFAAGKYADATLNYRNALKKNPNSGEAYYRLGLALLKQGQGGDAYQAFEHAVTFSPSNMDAKFQFANLALFIYTRDPKHAPVLYKQAQSMTDELMAPGGDRMQGLRIRAALALIDNKPGDAVQALREAAGIAPNNADVEGELAQALLRDNQPDEAEKTARQTVQQHPQFNPAYEVLYAIYGSQKKWDQAEALLKLWGANNPAESNPILRLAAFYYARRQPEDAEKTLNSLLDRRAQFPQADLTGGRFSCPDSQSGEGAGGFPTG